MRARESRESRDRWYRMLTSSSSGSVPRKHGFSESSASIRRIEREAKASVKVEIVSVVVLDG